MMALATGASVERLFLTRKLSIWVAMVAVQFSMSCLPEALAGTPVKIDVISESPAVTIGAKAQLRVNLLDAENRLAVANKDMSIEVEGQLPSGNIETSTVLV